jgi:hypothetical protein
MFSKKKFVCQVANLLWCYGIAYSIISPAKKQKLCSRKSPCPWLDSNLSLLISHMAMCFFTNVPANGQHSDF